MKSMTMRMTRIPSTSVPSMKMRFDCWAFLMMITAFVLQKYKILGKYLAMTKENSTFASIKMICEGLLRGSFLFIHTLFI